MPEQNLQKGDPVYPHYLKVRRYFIQGNASPTSFVKGEFATIDSNGFLAKLTTSKIGGLVQIRFNVTGGLAGDDTVGVTTITTNSRVLASLPAGAKAGDKLQINGADGTGNLVVSAAAVDLADLGVGTLFELYRPSGTTKVAGAGDLGVVDLGVF
jgi:hypothetical protein